MTRHVLVLTPSVGFGELVRQFFEDTGGFEAALYLDMAQAVDAARQRAFDLAVLDADFPESALPEMVRALRAANPEIGLIAIPAEERPSDPQLAQLQADHVLPSPFYLPDLMSALEALYGAFVPREVRTLRGAEAGRPPRKPISGEPQTAPEWLEDVSVAAQHLTRLSLESASQATLLTRAGEVWAYAGELPQPAAEELAAEVARHWEDAGADLARFVHLQATDGDYMLYATSLGGDFILAMVFDAEMPFSQMRAQAGDMADALAVPPQIERVAKSAEEAPAIRGEAGQPSLPDAVEPESSSANLPGAGGDGEHIPEDAPARPVSGLDAVSADPYDLRYTFVMIPRLPSHSLAGDLAAKLVHWLPQLCLAFGWRLEKLNVQPEFLEWTISMAHDASPVSVANTMDQHLSERVFEQFPPLKRENPSGKFWAPGFLIVADSPSHALIAEYIQQTRRRQGLPHNH